MLARPCVFKEPVRDNTCFYHQCLHTLKRNSHSAYCLSKVPYPNWTAEVHLIWPGLLFDHFLHLPPTLTFCLLPLMTEPHLPFCLFDYVFCLILQHRFCVRQQLLLEGSLDSCIWAEGSKTWSSDDALEPSFIKYTSFSAMAVPVGNTHERKCVFLMASKRHWKKKCVSASITPRTQHWPYPKATSNKHWESRDSCKR